MPPEAAISVRDLRKSYGPVEAVRGLSFVVSRGEVFGLLGPNGAGKTSTVEILEGYRPRTGGEVSVLGFDPQRGGRELRERMGIVLQSVGFYPRATVRESVEQMAVYYPHPRDVLETIALVGLEEKHDQRANQLSGGQRRRLDPALAPVRDPAPPFPHRRRRDLALALVGDPELIFLDEPTTGFDPAARRAAWQVIRTLRELGKTLLLTTHYLEEAQELADRVAIVKDGVIVASGPPAELSPRRAMYRVAWVQDGQRREIETDDPTEL